MNITIETRADAKVVAAELERYLKERRISHRQECECSACLAVRAMAEVRSLINAGKQWAAASTEGSGA